MSTMAEDRAGSPGKEKERWKATGDSVSSGSQLSGLGSKAQKLAGDLQEGL